MSVSFSAALFYPTSLVAAQLEQLVAGLLEDPALDTVDFPDENGGDASLELAIPFQDGMDEVRVEQAQLRLRARSKQLDISEYSVSAGTGGDVGVVLSLAEAARLAKVELTPTFPPEVTADPANANLRVVIRTATKQGASFEFGPSVYVKG